ncbi:hypothetical protein SDC9_61754 [bioreactor metagenome]|uniref:Uncharacterized protein n=1 Tax=bioreactor metagenome TaxID=1076179 RepID=A0A644XGN6_9ZZZZ
MNKFFFSLLALLLTVTAFSQDKPLADHRVSDFFGPEKIRIWEKQSPDSIKYYNFLVTHSFEIWKAENAALQNGSENAANVKLSEKNTEALDNLTNFNILETGLPFSKNEAQWFIIEGTDYYLMLHPISYIENKFKAGK